MSWIVHLHFSGLSAPPVAIRELPQKETASCASYTASSRELFSFKPTQRLVSSTYKMPAVVIDFLVMGVVIVTV